MAPGTEAGQQHEEPQGRAARLPADGRVRAVIENLAPSIDGGRFAIKRTVGETVTVEADVFADGHDSVGGAVLYREESSTAWRRAALVPLGNDRWRASFRVERLGRWLYTVVAWVDHLETWRRDLAKRHAAGQELGIELIRGARLARELAGRAAPEHAAQIEGWSRQLTDPSLDAGERAALAQSEWLRELAALYPDPQLLRRFDRELPVQVDRERARFSTWYEMFPRSAGPPGHHGSFADVEARLPYVAGMGFDVLYLPPIHPIGASGRKGPNNREGCAEGDGAIDPASLECPGSPWAIGSEAGGHESIHPQLGTLEDFRRLLARAAEHGVELALDIAFQCSPDHPYVREHREWFLERPDGTIQYAENPPKKYQDIYPFHFESDAWRELWLELESVVERWASEGVRIFRIDNPHTKPFAFWEWAIAELKRRRPELIFLSEAFTRPKVMYRLAKVGFTQSYTYFTWRNTAAELREYFSGLLRPPVSEFFRANLWPNTPDILPEPLQIGGRPAFVARLVLAATLGASYGIYGPAFELLEHEPREPGSEEYLDSEKYQLRGWDLTRAGNLSELVARVNRIRREHRALQGDRGLAFHEVDNPALLAYSKATEDGAECVIVVVNLDFHHVQSGWLELDAARLGGETDRPFQMHDLLSGARYLWQGTRNYVELDPQHSPAHVFRVRRRVRTERDFDYFL